MYACYCKYGYYGDHCQLISAYHNNSGCVHGDCKIYGRLKHYNVMNHTLENYVMNNLNI